MELKPTMASASTMPLVDPVLREGEPFFVSDKRKWVADDDRGVPSGSWQLAPASLRDPFEQGPGLIGEAAYSAQDRNLVSASAPIVSGVMALAGDNKSTMLEAGDVVQVLPYYGSKSVGVHVVKKLESALIDPYNMHIAVVAAMTHVPDKRHSRMPVSVPLICCGPVKLRVDTLCKLIPGFYSETNIKHPGEVFQLGRRSFIVMTASTPASIFVRCMMGYK